MAATVTNDELSAQARLISWRPSFLSSFPPPMFPVSLFSAPSWLSHGSSLFIPLPSIRPSLASPSSNRPGATGAQCPRKCGMAGDKSGVPLISAYDRGSVYGEHTANDFRCCPFVRTVGLRFGKKSRRVTRGVGGADRIPCSTLTGIVKFVKSKRIFLLCVHFTFYLPVTHGIACNEILRVTRHLCFRVQNRFMSFF